MQPKQNQSVISTENEEKCQKFCCKSAASNEKHYKSLFFHENWQRRCDAYLL